MQSLIVVLWFSSVLPICGFIVGCVCVSGSLKSSSSGCGTCALERTRRAYVSSPVFTALRYNRSALFSSTQSTSDDDTPKHSFLKSIKCHNLAGFFDPETSDHMISFALGPRMIAVTGETGSGKSLLVAKLVDLALGGRLKAASMIPEGTAATVEVTFSLREPHRSILQRGLVGTAGSDPPAGGELTVSRTLERRRSSKRVASSSRINDRPATLETVRALAAPLVAIVDAASAAAAVARPRSRLAALDVALTTTDPALLPTVRNAFAHYQACRNHRTRLERALKSLPQALLAGNLEDGNIMLQHWVGELNDFEVKVNELCSKAIPTVEIDCSFVRAARALAERRWTIIESPESGDDDGDDLFAAVLDFRQTFKDLETRIAATESAIATLASLSISKSAIVAVERARNLIFDATADEDVDSPLSQSAEQVHDAMNRADDAIREAASRLEDDHNGLLSMMTSIRSSTRLSMEDIDQVISEWNSIARKHGISPYTLRTCHKALREELTGTAEAKHKLPRAIADEAKTLELYALACRKLTAARQLAAAALSRSVSDRMESLGLVGSSFLVECHSRADFTAGSPLGVDAVDFTIQHGGASGSSLRRGGRLETVGSAGEKARILLAMECELPGSAGALCGSTATSSYVPPATILYDEIDSHVGGNAAVSMAKMLTTQAASQQVVSITHSPSVAAVADTHLTIRKLATNQSDKVPVQVLTVDGEQRKKELARMASGDLATLEAQSFADALLRDGALWRQDLQFRNATPTST